MSTNSASALDRVNSGVFPTTEQARTNSSGFRSPSSTTVSVIKNLSLDELIAGARAAAQHQLSIAKAHRFFRDADAGKAIADAETFATLIEKQIRKLEALPTIAALLLDVATEPDRHRPHDPAPDWAEVLAVRASTLLASLNA
jgi:hypothetical protein